MDYKTSQVEDEMNARFAVLQAQLDANAALFKKVYGRDLEDVQTESEALIEREKMKPADEFDIENIKGGMSADDTKSAVAAINRALRPAAAAPVAAAAFDIEKIGPGMNADDTKSAISSILSVLRADGFKG
jgi:hypothetical protein